MRTIGEAKGKIANYYKLKNRRIKVISHKGDYILEFRQLTNNTKPKALHQVERGKIVTTGIKFSPDAAICIIRGLLDRLEADGQLKNYKL